MKSRDKIGYCAGVSPATTAAQGNADTVSGRTVNKIASAARDNRIT
ncbi:hypothetical protein NT01EI_1804 [Edwardsiella ictaluri 93-146]|uniref:Uncharacterized protein n=1 Tax=Edwardsiella ictaluri (strain 93-146) TaxID=634503 RepID=C5BFL8_EDWI9|nr:hypothetical protein NT01EI_1804 [Edwardsiella ictaluri 93-146]